MNLAALANDIKDWGRALGFQQIAISDLDVSAYRERFERWLAEGRNGEMGYLERNLEKRFDASRLLSGSCRAIVARMDYLPPDTEPNKILEHGELGYVSRYALGRDYHKVVRARLRTLARKINTHSGSECLRAFTDSAPILEKALAEKAGLGWIGKHTLLLNRDAGSWFFLGEVLTDLPLPIDAGEGTDHCGRCRACISVCPTSRHHRPTTTRCAPLHLIPDDRIQRRNTRRIARAHRQPDLRLRRLPARLSLESLCATERRG